MWTPISLSEFEHLLEEQQLDLKGEAQRAFALYHVPTYRAILRRTIKAGEELVFVVANAPNGVLYFDDVEYGFNFSPVDNLGQITVPGGSQMELADAVTTWLVPLFMKEDIGAINPPPATG